jgi:hypothetical protein
VVVEKIFDGPGLWTQLVIQYCCLIIFHSLLFYGMKVYFLEAENGLVKIGYSGDVERRIRQLVAENATSVKLLGTIRGGRQTERALHRALRCFHSHGEWYYPNDLLSKYIRNRAESS